MKFSTSDIKNLYEKTLKFGFFIPYSNLLLTYGNKLLPDSLLKHFAKKRTSKINDYLLPIIEKVNKTLSIKPIPKITSVNTIWIYWNQGAKKMPPISNLCYNYLKRNAGSHKVIFLSLDNYKDFVVLPEFIESLYNSGKIKHAHFADILRIYLLAQQGGLWLDATILTTSPIPDYIFQQPFWTIKIKPFGNFVSQCRWSVFALEGQKDNPLFVKLSKAFELYLSETSIFIDYFLFDHFIDLFYNSDPEIKKLIDDVPFNNPEVHALEPRLCQDFNSSWWKKIKENTSFFKLSNRSYTSAQLNSNPDSFYKYFEKEIIS